MRVTWHARKAAANLKKHKVSFDPLAITCADPAHSVGEIRWITFGLSNRWRLLAVAHTDEHDIIHLLSARAATRPERRLYEEGRSHDKDELRRSYKRSCFPAGFTRGKYAARLAAGSNVVVLSPKNAAAFPTSDGVNEALDGLLRVAKSARQTSRSSGRRSR